MDKPVFSEDEIELIDFLNIIWGKKWFIVIPTILCIIAVGITSYFLPLKWEIDAIIQPGKMFIKTEGGNFEEIVVVEPNQIASQINQKTYNNLISDELNMNIKEFPKVRAEKLQNTNLVRVFIKEKDVQKAKLILNSLFNHLKTQIDMKVSIEMKEIDTEIKSKDLEKSRLEEEIRIHKNKLSIIKQRKKEIEAEMSEIRKRAEVLEKEQESNLKKQKRSESESLAMLLYSNEIQQSLRYFNTLNELLNSKRIEEEDTNLEIDNIKAEIKQIENLIDNLNERRGRIDYAQLIKEPTSSTFPVSPKRKLIILMTGILSLIFFIALAFFVEYIEVQKLKEKNRE